MRIVLVALMLCLAGSLKVPRARPVTPAWKVGLASLAVGAALGVGGGLMPPAGATSGVAGGSITPIGFLTSVEKTIQTDIKDLSNFLPSAPSPSGQSPGWELARHKRTAAIKLMQEKKILRVETDEKGYQYLSLPWIPDKRITYKSLDLSRRLTNEACAGALGEITKDALLYSVDTRKTRAQIKGNDSEGGGGGTGEAMPQSAAADGGVEALEFATHGDMNMGTPMGLKVQGKEKENLLMDFKALYAGFPVVLASSIPQGAVFFLAKGGLLEAFSRYLPGAPAWSTSIVPIVLGTMVYWLIRTPTEVIKTKVQANEFPDVTSAFENIQNTEGVPSLWKFYSVMLSLDVPFQVINFILFGVLSDMVVTAGVEQNLLTRLGVGIGCGMVSAAVTCPLDVVKTRIQTKVKRSNVVEDGHAEKDRKEEKSNINVLMEMADILKNEGVGTLFLGLPQRVVYTGLANGLRFAAYGTSRMDLMMRSLDDI
jgi:solute carrier family 25 S-adenosylmethionine transporter 26